jgi:hypothetical protein
MLNRCFVNKNMKTTLEDKRRKYIRIEHNQSLNSQTKEVEKEDPEVEVEMIQLSPSFLNMPMFKFVVVKNNKK